MTIKKEFTPDMAALGKEFDLEKNRVKREAYRANHTREQKQEVLAKWKEFMKKTSSNVPFFESLRNILNGTNSLVLLPKKIGRRKIPRK